MDPHIRVDSQSNNQSNSGYAVFLEPGQHPLPSIFGGLRVVAGTIVGIEAVTGVGIDHDLRWLAGGFERGAHLLDLRRRDSHIFAAVQS